MSARLPESSRSPMNFLDLESYSRTKKKDSWLSSTALTRHDASSRGFAVTDFVHDINFWKAFIRRHYPRYLIVGDEICPNTGKPHFQVAFFFTSERSYHKFKKLLNGRHIETCIAQALNNEVYCNKEKIILEHGSRPSQGKRTDLIELKADLEEGKTTVDEITLMNPYAYHLYGRTLHRIEDILLRQRRRSFMTEGIWYFGRTGTGKSHAACLNSTPDSHYIVPIRDRGWWDGYTGQPIVVIQEFRGQLTYGELLEMVDRYPYSVPRRNHQPVPFLAKTVIITSPTPPAECFHNLAEDDNLDQLLERFNVIECTKYKPFKKNLYIQTVHSTRAIR